MNHIKFSVVIPTRERAETLQHCLRTCLVQNFDDYEVVVSDNGSSPRKAPIRSATVGADFDGTAFDCERERFLVELGMSGYFLSDFGRLS